MPVDVRILRGLPIFAELDDELVQQIAAIAQVIEFRAEERLFDVGERPRCVYVLRSGQVALGTHGTGGEFVAVEVCRTGDIFATPPVLLDRPSLMAATTLERCELVCIAASEFRELLRRDPSVAMAMVASIATGYRALVRQISDLKSRSVAQRLGCYLLSLADEQGASEIVLPFEKRLLASRIGTTPESLSRAFAILRSCAVTTRGRVVSLGNGAVLSRFARPDRHEDRSAPAGD